MEPNLVILAGGISSRMKNSAAINVPAASNLIIEAKSKAKSMIGLGASGRPFFDYLLFNAREAGYTDIVVVVGDNDEDIRKHYGDAEYGNDFYGLTISYARQKIPAGRTKPLGTADALSCALHSRPDWKNQKFTVCNSDNLYSVHVFELLLDSPHPNAMIDYDRDALKFEKSRIEKFAIIETDREGWLMNIIEKPTPEELAAVKYSSGRIGVSMNIFRFSYKDIFSILGNVPLHPVRQEKELPTAIMRMINKSPTDRMMMTYPVAEIVPDLSEQDDIPRVQEYLHSKYPNFTFE
ncbi:MAG: sugar phosphate nucleotidyltransferase [Bacteroidota bacterium]